MKYKIIPLQPFGIELIFEETFSIQDVDDQVIEDLLNKHHLLLVRQSNMGEKEKLVSFSQRFGKLLEWEFGNVMEMKPSTDAKNYLFTNEKVPFHWDGAFYQSPRFLVFNCINAPSLDAKGETLFTNTEMILNDMNQQTVNEWKKLKLSYQTEKAAHYGGNITADLVQIHPVTGEQILRFAEPVTDTMLNPVKVVVINHTPDESTKLIDSISSYCYADEYCYTHSWQDDDLIIADNYALLHGRNAFKDNSPRHLRRIQILLEQS